MKVFNTITKVFILPIYYAIHKNILFGFFHKNFIKKFYYKNITINLNIKNIPMLIDRYVALAQTLEDFKGIIITNIDG